MAFEWVIARGQVGAIRYGRARDAEGYVDLSVFDTIHFIAHSSLTSNPVINAPVSVVGDQNDPAFTGRFSFTFDATTANIAVRKYDYCALKCMEGVNPTYFPLDKSAARSYFKLVVLEPVG